MKWITIMLTWMLLMTGCQLKEKFESTLNEEVNRVQDGEELHEESVAAELIKERIYHLVQKLGRQEMV